MIMTDQIKREIEATMRERGVERFEAEVIVGLRHAELLGDGDQLCLRQLTDEEKRRLGIGRQIDDVLAEQRTMQG